MCSEQQQKKKKNQSRYGFFHLLCFSQESQEEIHIHLLRINSRSLVGVRYHGHVSCNCTKLPLRNRKERYFETYSLTESPFKQGPHTEYRYLIDRDGISNMTITMYLYTIAVGNWRLWSILALNNFRNFCKNRTRLWFGSFQINSLGIQRHNGRLELGWFPVLLVRSSRVGSGHSLLGDKKKAACADHVTALNPYENIT